MLEVRDLRCGYGKTEIAVRAAFKAVQDGKQVAVLVPTTLLAQQHLQTFTERMAAFPVTVKGLSRFTDASDSRAITEGMADGTVDIVVGTHRLLNKFSKNTHRCAPSPLRERSTPQGIPHSPHTLRTADTFSCHAPSSKSIARK